MNPDIINSHRWKARGLGALMTSAVLGALALSAGADYFDTGGLPTQPAGSVHVVSTPNWAGYATGGAPFSISDAKASWTQPRIDCDGSAPQAVSVWAGIDGVGSRSIEQVGTTADCQNGRPHYFGFWEMLPAPAVNMPIDVDAGDRLTAEVTALGNTPISGFRLTLADESNGQRFTTTQSIVVPAGHVSAEFIVEAPLSCDAAHHCAPVQLPGFHQVHFKDVTVNGSALGARANILAINMVDHTGKVLVATSVLEHGNAFKATPAGQGEHGDSQPGGGDQQGGDSQK